jgi:hypothetical protein
MRQFFNHNWKLMLRSFLMGLCPGSTVLVSRDLSLEAWILFGMVSLGTGFFYFGLQLAGRRHVLKSVQQEVKNECGIAVPAQFRTDVWSAEGVLYRQHDQLYFRTYRPSSREKGLAVALEDVKNISPYKKGSQQGVCITTMDGRELHFTTEEEFPLADRLNASLSKYWIKRLVSMEAGNRNN